MEKATCSVCENEYDKAFEVKFAERTYHFDCLECAIHLLAPTCQACGIRIVGHGVDVDQQMFCCAHCAKKEIRTDVKDRDDSIKQSA